MQAIGCRNPMMHQIVQELQVTTTDRANVIFLLRSSLNSLSIAVDNLVNPILKISEEARMQYTFSQRVAVENAFILRTANLKRNLALLKQELAQPEMKIFANRHRIRSKLEALRNEYLRSEMVFGYYVDLLHTRAIQGFGKILKGYDYLATETLKRFLQPLGHEIPKVVVYLEQIGDGAAIMRADISLWDRLRNPCAIIKMPQNSVRTPRSSIFHEAGHQIGSITGLNREVARLLYNTIRNVGGPDSEFVASYWKHCATEIVADQIATQLTNWIGAITLYNIYSGSSGSELGTGGRMFTVTSPHLMGYLRIKSNIESCRLVFGGRGPWDQMDRSVDILYPLTLASRTSVRIIEGSLPLLPRICKSLAHTKLISFGGRSFEDICPMNANSLRSVRRLLNLDLSNFSVNRQTMLENPILTFVAFGIIQMLGGKSLYWVTAEMEKFLSALGDRMIN
jgi:hypothetical protein